MQPIDRKTFVTLSDFVISRIAEANPTPAKRNKRRAKALADCKTLASCIAIASKNGDFSLCVRLVAQAHVTVASIMATEGQQVNSVPVYAVDSWSDDRVVSMLQHNGLYSRNALLWRLWAYLNTLPLKEIDVSYTDIVYAAL